MLVADLRQQNEKHSSQTSGPFQTKALHSFEMAESAYLVTKCQLYRNLNNSVKIPELAK